MFPKEGQREFAESTMSRTTLRTREVRSLLSALDRLYAPVIQADFADHFFGVIEDLLPGTAVSFDFMDLSTGKVESHVTPGTSRDVPRHELEAVVREFLWQNPVMDHLVGGSPTAVMQPTDLISQREFRRTDLYALAFRPLRMEYQVAAGLAWRGHAGGFTVNRSRSRNFTDYEVALIHHLRPHVERAFAAAVRAGKRPQPLQIDGALTQREEEVLRWLSLGKRNTEIAMILGISPRTVQKHVEHVFEKLGVENRTALVAATWERT